MDKVRKVNELVANIASASKEQSDGIGQVHTAVGEMDQVTQANAANAEQSAAAANELEAQADALQTALGKMTQLMEGSKNAAAPAPLSDPPQTVPPGGPLPIHAASV